MPIADVTSAATAVSAIPPAAIPGGIGGGGMTPNGLELGAPPRSAFMPNVITAYAAGAAVRSPPTTYTMRSGSVRERKWPRTARIVTPIASPMLQG